MKYCADTWFVLKLFKKDPKALAILEDTTYGKARIVIPITVYAEATKKLMQLGITILTLKSFLDYIEISRKVETVDANKSIAEEAAKISFSYRVPLIDSFVAATCKLTQCDILLADDSDYELLAKKKYLKVQLW